MPRNRNRNRKITTYVHVSGVEVQIELHHDSDGRYRWYETESGADCEVSGYSVKSALAAAWAAWPGQIEMSN